MNALAILLASCLVIAPAGEAPNTPPPVPAGRRLLEPFDYRG